MNEKMKKAVYSFLYRGAVAIVAFAFLYGVKAFMPDIFQKCSAAWRKNADMQAAAGHIKDFFKEIAPF